MDADAVIFLKSFEKVTASEARVAFFHLLTRLSNETRLFWRPYQHGRQPAVHFSFDPDGPITGYLRNGPQFACDGAQSHLTWWFRRPCIDFKLIHHAEIAAQFDIGPARRDSEIVIKLTRCADVDKLVPLLKAAETRYREQTA